MRIQCPNCPAMYELDDGRVPPAGLSIKCPKCKSGFVAHRPEDGSQMARTTAAKIPLPGTPRPAAQPQKPKGNAIPLPGTQSQLKKPPAAKPVPAAAKPAAAAAKSASARAAAPEDAPTEQID